MILRWALALLLAVAACLAAAPLSARPGGGDDYDSSPSPDYSPSPSPDYSPSPSPDYSPSPSPYSGSSDPSPWSPSSPSYSGGGGGGGGGGVGSLFGFVFVVALGVFVAVVAKGAAERRQQDWATDLGPSFTFVAPVARPKPKPEKPLRPELAALAQKHDPEFSLVLFEDFIYSLFAAYHEARGGSRRHDVAPYVAAQAAEALAAGKKDDVRTVIVGAMTITNCRVTGANLAVEVSFKANYQEVDRGVAQAYYAKEQWVLQRSLAAKSRPPDRASIADCPNCGASLADLDGNVCSYCRATLTPCRFDWAVTHITAERHTRKPMLSGSTMETGTDLPTIIAPGAELRYQSLTQRDRTFDWSAFQKRVKVIFGALHAGWVARDWRTVRPYVSDQLFQSQLYWIEEYRRQGLINRTDGARTVAMTMSNVETDKHFDAITIRLFATGKDYLVDEAGQLRSGSKTYDRNYSEYWTLIRGRAVQRATRTEATCPQCGAALAVNMAGACEHCRVKVTRGDFDWVLSRIEQD